MCVVSNIGTEFNRTVPDRYPWAVPGGSGGAITTPAAVATKAEMDALRLEMQELRKLLAAAKAYDAATGQPDCEMDEKVALIKRLAEIVGVDMGDVFEKVENKS